jgi:hypothetical protein
MAITGNTNKTNLPIFDETFAEFTQDQKQNQFFSNYYTQVDSVDPAQFDIVRGFLVGKNFDESTVDNLVISLLEVAKEQDLSIPDIIEQLDSLEDTLQLNTLLSLLLNTTRNRTSILGFEQTTPVTDNISRTILA